MLKRYPLRWPAALLLLASALAASPPVRAQCPAAQVVLTPAGPTTFPLGGSVVLRAAATALGFNGGLAGPDDTPHALAAQPDGKILVGGQFSEYNDQPHVGLLRILPDGAPDTTFVVDRRTAPAQRLILTPYALAVQPDGKVLAGGYVQQPNQKFLFGLVRLLPDGSLDKAFEVVASPDTAAIYTISLQPDGKILVGGIAGSRLALGPYMYGQRAFVARLNPDGSYDPTFVRPNRTLPARPTGVTPAGLVRASLVQPDGKLLVATEEGVVLRLNADGSLDATFNATIYLRGATIWALSRQTDGKLVVGGYFGNWFRNGVLRLNADGSLDPSYQPNGVFAAEVRALLPLPGNQVLAAGLVRTRPNGQPFTSLVRLNPDGTRDPGLPYQQFLGGPLSSLVLQPTGQVVAGGGFCPDSLKPDNYNYLVRLNPDGSYDQPGAPLAGGEFRFSGGSGTGAARTITASGSYTATYTSASGCTYTSAPVLVAATAPLATRAAWEAAGPVLAPNPAHGTISCTVPGLAGATRVQATLVNSLGQAVHTQAAALPATGTHLVLDATRLAPGLYSLLLRAGAATLAKKVVLE
ncbi:MAG: hypothetical protein ACRYF0_05780 [Janthinobacterium lividum]